MMLQNMKVLKFNDNISQSYHNLYHYPFVDLKHFVRAIESLLLTQNLF